MIKQSGFEKLVSNSFP